MKELLFTSSSLLSILTQIEELKDVEVGISDDGNGNIQLQIGDSIYDIKPDNDVVDINVSQDDLSDIQEAAEDVLNDLSEQGEVTLEEYVESGPIVELLKTLLVGGLVRAGVKSLTK